MPRLKASYDELLNAIALPAVVLPVAPALPPPPSSEGPLAAPADPDTDLDQMENHDNDPIQASPNPVASPVTPTAGTTATAIYLSDRDLLTAQPATDDGEVDE